MSITVPDTHYSLWSNTLLVYFTTVLASEQLYVIQNVFIHDILKFVIDVLFLLSSSFKIF